MSRQVVGSRGEFQTLIIVSDSEFVYERVRLALEAEKSWEIRIEPEIGPLVALSRDVSPSPAVVLIPLTSLDRLSPRPFPFPVLAYGSPTLFDSIPDGVCDDLINENWSSAEVRFRLHRLVRPQYRLLPGRTITCTAHTLSTETATVTLHPAQHAIIHLLLRADGATVPREALAAAAGSDPAGRSIDMTISRLRKSLHELTRDWPDPPRILSRRGRGYALVAGPQKACHEPVDNPCTSHDLHAEPHKY